MRYPVAIEHGDDSRAWGVVVPDLPGCFSAGDTLDEAIENARGAIALHIDGLLDDGEAVPIARAAIALMVKAMVVVQRSLLAILTSRS